MLKHRWLPGVGLAGRGAENESYDPTGPFHIVLSAASLAQWNKTKMGKNSLTHWLHKRTEIFTFWWVFKFIFKKIGARSLFFAPSQQFISYIKIGSSGGVAGVVVGGWGPICLFNTDQEPDGCRYRTDATVGSQNRLPPPTLFFPLRRRIILIFTF